MEPPTEREWFDLFTMINNNLASIANSSNSIAFPESSAGPLPVIINGNEPF